MKYSYLFSITLFSFLSVTLFSQSSRKVDTFFTEGLGLKQSATSIQVINTTSARDITVDLSILKEGLADLKRSVSKKVGDAVFIELPDPDGGVARYEVFANTTMHPDLQKKFSDIRTFDIVLEDDPSIHGKMDFTEFGFHAMIFDVSRGTFFIDPKYHGEKESHIVYYRNNFFTDKAMSCEFEGDSQYEEIDIQSINKSYGTCELKTYRLALSATGEYTTYHGGTVSEAASAQVTTMNRVNGMFERDMAITLTIVADNDDIIYTNAATDPFTNGSPGDMIDENQETCDDIILTANYDIGHVFGTNSGGLAGLGVVCNSNSKARGVTGSANPVGDPFDIDYVAHEMGHQFGCNHTFNNSCNSNRNNSTAIEPGSGSTIMAYAGICVPNVQSNSDDHFHGISLLEMGNFTTGNGATCPVVTEIDNVAPAIEELPASIVIPASTPFALTASASDEDGDSLLYCWEQTDAEISVQPPSPNSVGGPNFRSNSPNYSSTRYFPDLQDLADDNVSQWEVLAAVTRSFNFKLIVRDNVVGGGCNDHADIQVEVDGNSGPFVLSYPSDQGITWEGLSSQTVTWDVANTDLAPVSCELVDIFISLDGGANYDIQLADDVVNDGSHIISAPNLASTECRVMVMSKSGTFFDISDNDFEITLNTVDFSMSAEESSLIVCPPDDAVYNIEIGSTGGFNESVDLSVLDLPADLSANFETNPVTPASNVNLTISGSDLLSPGSYEFTVEASSTTGSKFLVLNYILVDDAISAVSLIYPSDDLEGVGVPINLNWSDAGIGAIYDLEVASDIDFNTIILAETGLSETSYSLGGLEATTTYYWRVSAYNVCVSAPISEVYSFTTGTCFELESVDVPVSISSSSTPTVTSTLDVTQSGTILDVNVVNLTGFHTWINDLTITLTSPEGTEVTLFSAICGNEDDWDLNFDDQADPGSLPCPPNDGGWYQAEDLLSAFNGEESDGTWTLTISDSFNQDGGSLESWGIELCTGICNDADIPVISASELLVCPGEAVTFSIESGNLNDATEWNWYEASCSSEVLASGATVNIEVNESASFYANGVGGCTGIDALCASIDVDVFETSTENVEASICNGETYTFPDGSTSSVSTVNTSVLIDVNGCDSIIITDLTMINMNQTVIYNDGVLISNHPPSTGSYQWIDCNNNNEAIVGATEQEFVPTENGSYAVILTSLIDPNCSETSNCVEVIGVGIEDVALTSFTISPNPSAGVFKIEFADAHSYETLQVMDSRGKVVYLQKLFNEKVIEINISDLSEGVYILRMSGKDGTRIEKLIKN